MKLARLNPSYTGEMTAAQWQGQTVVAFGDARVDEAIPAGKVWRVDNPAGDGLRALNGGLNPKRIKGGFAFVLPEALDAPNAAAVVEIQKALVFLYYKYVFFPHHSLSTTDVLGVRPEPLPDIVREINQLRNYPWLLSAPLTDKLARRRIGMPLTALLPGPSLQDVLPRLKELRKHTLIACVARTLRDCLAAGVQPDFVLQLDTFQIQRHFYEGLPDMPETLLVPLSICPFYPYADKFRGVVMMDSFNLELLPNPARLRESYVSSLTACLGLAEALHSPTAYIVGANLSSPGKQEDHPYHGRSQGPLPIFAGRKHYRLSARNGAPVQALDYFIATALEVEQFAADIRKATGTRFFSTTNDTLLSRKWFPHAPLQKIEALPEIDRTGFLAAVDAILGERESINLTKVRMKVLKDLSEMRQIERVFNSEDVPRDALDAHMLTKAVRKMRNPFVRNDVDGVAVAARVSTRWRESLNDARLLVQAMTNAAAGRKLPLLCFEGEVDALLALLGRIVRGAEWELYTFPIPPHPPFAGATAVPQGRLMHWLTGEQVVFASPGMMREFAYVMEYVPGDNVYDLRNITGSEG